MDGQRLQQIGTPKQSCMDAGTVMVVNSRNESIIVLPWNLHFGTVAGYEIWWE